MNRRWTTCLLMLGLTASAAACGDDESSTNSGTGTGGAGAAGSVGQGGDGGTGGVGGDGGTGGVGGAGGAGGTGGVGGGGGTGGVGGTGGAGGVGGAGGTGGVGGAGGTGGVGGAGGAGGTGGGASSSSSGSGGSGGGTGAAGGVEGTGGGTGGAGGTGGLDGSGGGIGASGTGGVDGAGGLDGSGGAGGSTNLLPDGAACTEDAMCASNFCNPEAINGWPGGYCLGSCEDTGGACAGHGVCVDTRDNGHLCYAGCSAASDCRPGYACVAADDGTRICRPRCTEDAQCPTRGRCNASTGLCRIYEASCADGLDDDDDAAIDCSDDDCEAACAEIAEETCAAAKDAPPEISGDTSLGTSAFEGTCTGEGREDVYRIEVPEDQPGTLFVEVESDTDHGLYLRSSCAEPDAELGCADLFWGGAPEWLELVVQGGEDVSVVVDAEQPGDEGPYTLRSTFTPAICGDGVLTRPEQCNNDGPGACAEDCATLCDGAREALLGENTGDTWTGTTVIQGRCSLPDTREDAYWFVPPADGTLTLVLSSETDQVLEVRSSCADASSEIVCNDHAGPGADEVLVMDVTGDVPLFIFVDGFWNQLDAGPYTLYVDFEPAEP